MDNPKQKSHSPQSLSYFDEWRHVQLCCACGWSGSLDPDRTEPHASLLEFSCPSCDSVLALVHYPTDEEMLANIDQLSDEERTNLGKRQDFLQDARRLALQSPQQLPDLEGAALILHWDFVTKGHTHYTIIRHHDQEVWRELAFWEGVERYQKILELLKAKYGDRLYDLIPTESSLLYLYGDSLSAPENVQQLRSGLAP